METSLKKPLLTLCVAAALSAGSAHALPQDDVAKCRAAFADMTNKSVDEYRLKFDSVKGRRVRTLQIIAIPNDRVTGKRFRFSCTIDRNEVTEIVVNTKQA